MSDYFQGFVADKPHPLMDATGSEGRCELCALRENPLHDAYKTSELRAIRDQGNYLEKSMECAACNKPIDRYAEEDYPGTQTPLRTTPDRLIGVSIIIKPPTIGDKKGETYLQRQLGPYQIGKAYCVCYECWLRSLGVKP
jgi:hypothetical protein